MERSSDAADGAYLIAAASAIGNVADQFRNQPASFLYESDLQALLFTRLFDLLSTHATRWGQHDKGWSMLPSGRPLLMNPVKSEYPGGVRFDVAVISSDVQPNVKAWNQPVRIGIEIKFRQVDGTGHHFHGDVDKLSTYATKARAEGRRFTGLCLVFSHSPNDPCVVDWVANGGLVKNPTELVVPGEGLVKWAFTPEES